MQHIIKIAAYHGDHTSIDIRIGDTNSTFDLDLDWKPGQEGDKYTLYAVVECSKKDGAVIIDNGYATMSEAQEAFPEAWPRKNVLFLDDLKGFTGLEELLIDSLQTNGLAIRAKESEACVLDAITYGRENLPPIEYAVCYGTMARGGTKDGCYTHFRFATLRENNISLLFLRGDQKAEFAAYIAKEYRGKIGTYQWGELTFIERLKDFVDFFGNGPVFGHTDDATLLLMEDDAPEVEIVPCIDPTILEAPERARGHILGECDEEFSGEVLDFINSAVASCRRPVNVVEK